MRNPDATRIPKFPHITPLATFFVKILSTCCSSLHFLRFKHPLQNNMQVTSHKI